VTRAAATRPGRSPRDAARFVLRIGTIATTETRAMIDNERGRQLEQQTERVSELRRYL